MDALVPASGQALPAARVRVRRAHAETFAALAAFAVLCVLVLSVASRLVEPDDYAYRASIVAITQGHFLTLSTAQVDRLAVQLPAPVAARWRLTLADRTGRARPVGAARLRPGCHPAVGAAPRRAVDQREGSRLPVPGRAVPGGRGHPAGAAVLRGAGLPGPVLRGPALAGPLRRGGRRGAVLLLGCGAAVCLARLHATFTDASLIAAGTGALLWAVLAADATARRRTWVGLAGFTALKVAVFVRYTDIVVLGCAVVAVAAAAKLRAVPAAALGWWLGSVAVSGAAVALFDDLVYGGPLRSGYRPGEISFSLRAVLPNLRYMPAHLIQAMPMLVLGLAALAWIAGRRVRLRSAGEERAAPARRDLAVGLALAASWFSVWGLYAAYSWTAVPFVSTLQSARFYVPAIGAISLLGSWLVTRLPRRASLAAVTSAAVAAAIFGLGAWSFTVMRESPIGGIHKAPPGVTRQTAPGRQPGA